MQNRIFVPKMQRLPKEYLCFEQVSFQALSFIRVYLFYKRKQFVLTVIMKMKKNFLKLRFIGFIRNRKSSNRLRRGMNILYLHILYILVKRSFSKEYKITESKIYNLSTCHMKFSYRCTLKNQMNTDT